MINLLWVVLISMFGWYIILQNDLLQTSIDSQLTSEL